MRFPGRRRSTSTVPRPDDGFNRTTAPGRSNDMTADGTPSTPAEVRLRDVRPTTVPIEVVGTIISLERKEITRRSDGLRRPLLSGRLSDGTATVRFTWWDPPRETIDRGTILRATGVEVTEFRGRPELTFTWRTRVGPAGPAELPLADPNATPRMAVHELRPSDEGFRVEVRVVRVTERTVSVGEERRVVYDGLVGDRSGVVALSAWSDFALKVGESVRIAGGYVRAFRGRPQLVVDERATVTRIAAPDLPEAAELARSPLRTIAQLEDAGGGEVVAVEGIVVGLLPPSGVVYRCPSCRRSVTSGICRIHGQVEGYVDLRARIVLDDGTGAVTISAGRAATEELWGVSLEEARLRLREQPDPTVLEEELFEALLGRRLRIRGSATQDDFGITVHPESIERAEVDLDAAADELGARVGPRN